MRHQASPPDRFSIAIVGLGPRGLSVLERLLIRLRRHPADRRMVIWAIDPVEHGPGRVWRTTQPDWLMTNATAGEVTARSPDSPLSESRHSLATWTVAGGRPGPEYGPVDYPPRRVYGEYLSDLFQRLRASAPPGVEVRPRLGEATRLTRAGGRLRLTVGHREAIVVDKVVLTTGHGWPEPTADQHRLLRHARRHPGCAYLWDGMAADLPLDEIAPGTHVAVRGLGLTFYDVVRAISVGRGGRFVRSPDGRLSYEPSGREPRIVAGSRGGLPFRARPRMTEPPETAPRPVVLTEGRVARLRAAAAAERGTTQLDFAGDVEPLVHAEVEHAYYTCAARLRAGRKAAERLGADYLAALDDPARTTGGVVAAHGLADLPSLRLHELGRPFDGQTFTGPSHFRDRLVDALRADVMESRHGTSTSPLKAGLEVLRQIRPLLPSVVDFGGLTPASHRDFLSRFEPLSYVLSAGPPDADVERLVALIESGLVEVVGPAATFFPDKANGGFEVESPRVAGSRRHASVMIEARLPGKDLRRSAAPLFRRMLADGLISEYVNTGVNGERFATGGLAVTRAPYHVVDRRGRPDPDIYALGVAADGPRWFTQVGTGRPGQNSPFCSDADAVAADLLRPVKGLSADGQRPVAVAH